MRSGVPRAVSRVVLVVLGISFPLRAPADRTILLVDDHHVLYRSGTKRVLHPLKRHALNPLIRPDKPWENGTVAYCSVYRAPDTKRYQMWYQAWTPRSGCFLCYATSSDGLKWEKPELGLVEYKGNRNNNILLSIGYGAGVLCDPRDPDARRRYKFAYWEHNGTSVAFSPDGIHWTKHPDNPVIHGSYGGYRQPRFATDPDDGSNGPPLSTSDVTDPIWDAKRRCFAIYAKTWLDGPDGTMHWKRAVVRTDSKDFVHWSKPQLIMQPDEFDGYQGEEELARTAGGGGSGGKQLHSGPAFFHNDVYFSLLQVMDPDSTGTMPIELAISRDGYRWTRPFRKSLFLPSLADTTKFDASVIWSNGTPVYLEDETRFYYGAYGKPWNSADRTQLSGIGLATMPRDRFAGIRPCDKIGQITLRALDLQGVGRVLVNTDASAGTVRVELLNEDGYRIRGFSKNDAVALTGDSLRHAARWNQREWADLPAGRYRLRLHLENAEVFAVRLLGTGE